MKRQSGKSIRDLTLLLDALNCGAFLVDRSGRVVHANPRLGDMIGTPAERLIGQDLRERYESATDREQIDEFMRRFEEASEREFHVPRADGTSCPVIVSGRQLAGDPPLSDHRVVTLVDISQQKEAERSAHTQFVEISKLSDTVIEQALALKGYSKTLEQRVRERTQELHDANMDAILMLAVASEAKDEDTGAHVRRIQRYSEALATELGLPPRQAERLGYSAILHDVGKIHIPDSILQKPGPLTPEERATMQTHTIVGQHILSSKSFFSVAREIARHHHENWDGTGYPDQLAGEAIPQSARIVHVADVVDALTATRVYKPAWTLEKTGTYIQAEAGKQFDAEVVSAFTNLWQSGRLAALMQSES